MTDNTDDKTLATLESEARARAEAALKKSAPETEKKPGQAEVSTLRKHRKNRLMTVSLLFLAGLLILAWTGDRVLQHFLHPGGEKAAAKPAESAVATQKRTGMGLDTDTMLAEEAAGDEDKTAAETAASNPVPATLNKSLALSATQGEQTHSGQNAPQTRQAEQTGTTATPGETPPSTVEAVTQAHTISRITLDPDLYIPVDTYIPCTLQTRFVSDVSGHIGCIISEDVYSASTHVRLIKAGTQARGMYKTGTLKQGQSRMFIIWTELRTPDGLKIPMVDSQVVGQLGEAGIDGWIDTHFWERAGNTLLVSIVPDLAAAAADNAPGKDRNTDYTENTRAGVAEIAKSMMENAVNIPPTIYKNQGEIIGIMTGDDIDFSGVYTLTYKGGHRERD